MYLGSTLNFLAMAIGEQSVSGLIMTAIVYVVYIVYSVWLENPYTAWIYSEKARHVREREDALEAKKNLGSASAASSKSPSKKKKVE